ncbi:menaquinol-cytochrome c reductase cytochrome c subunit [Mycobacterium kansasii]|uniref:Cytochrome bc1 complex cytochrome c subunit n=1 Tax=Mycobacterium kansasii TaxID=1768 RepID=A0A1V3WMH4_MYCKA|nr:menaquinol-cytochrome c reductase cytochrome c subunit [Mycobacterium kansasii]
MSGGLLLLIALTVAGGLAAVLTPTPQVAVADESSSALLRTGKQLFDTSCVSCHGANLQGVPDHGPSLIGVGEAAVYFQVSTGRMPAMRGEAQAQRKEPIFDEAQIDALGAYVQANGAGPPWSATPTAASPPNPCGETTWGAGRLVPSQLRLVPQLHRQGRRAVVGQIRARPGARQ